MGALITCFEQNDESPYGFKETLTWGNPESEECQSYPDLCEAYNREPYAGKGDVCDHTDPTTGITRNACKMSVMFGAEVNAEKTWSWKCAELSTCSLKDDNGVGMEGCLITDKRIMCCCQTDYCTNGTVYAQYAAFGRSDHWPIDYAQILAIDSGDMYVQFDIDSVDSSDSIEEESTENHNDINQISIEMCFIKEATPSPCSCGYQCVSVEYEYKAIVSNKCGDEQLLITGEYGAGTCNPNNMVYQVGQSYECKVLSCENGEFAILDNAIMISQLYGLMAGFMFYYMILY